MKKFDVVIPLKMNESAWGESNELKYLLRSLDENFPVKRVIIVSESLPSWINKDEIIHIEHGNPFRHHKDANLILKILAAINQVKDLTDTFYWSCDDHLVLRKPKTDELRPFFLSELKNEQSHWWAGVWKEGMRRTMDLLEKKGKPTYHYDTHIPQPMEKEKALKIFGDVKLEEGKRWCINTLYFNQAGLRKHYHVGILKARFERSIDERSNIETLAYNRLYAGYNDAGLTKTLQEFIIDKFPKPSKYEK